ncbi:MAG: hypothetical protein ACRC6T_05350 [Sarcina sp.]
MKYIINATKLNKKIIDRIGLNYVVIQHINNCFFQLKSEYDYNRFKKYLSKIQGSN